MHPDSRFSVRPRRLAALSSVALALASCSDGPPVPMCSGRTDAGSRAAAPCAADAAPQDALGPASPSDGSDGASDAPAEDAMNSVGPSDGSDGASDTRLDREPRDAAPDAAPAPDAVDALAPDAGDVRAAAANADADAAMCDLSRDPNDEPCLVDEAYGVFVATSGQQGASGSRTDPMPTIAQAIDQAASTGRSRVYVCQGQYEEGVLLDSAHDGISLYGGFACLDHWRAGASPSVVQSPKPLFALHVDSLTRPVRIDDFVFASADATAEDPQGNGGSSIAALVNASTVTLRRVSLLSGHGARGLDGAAGSAAPNYSAPIAPAGGAGSLDVAGAGGDSQCTLFGSSNGGAGRQPWLVTYPASPGTCTPPAPAAAPLDGLGGDTVCPSGLCTFAGHPGAPGLAATVAAAPAASYGAMSSAGWVPSVGGDGTIGNPGQGGGGAGGQAISVASCQPTCIQWPGGTGGGAGGCGGSPGKGGGGGGASIALVSLHANVLLAQGKLQTAAAGSGGNGGAGQDGQKGGPSAPSASGYPGGLGGNGAGGGGGAGGTGGVAAGVAYQGVQPTLDSTSIMLGAPGSPGAAGAGGAHGGTALDSGHPGANGVPGRPGTSINVWPL